MNLIESLQEARKLAGLNPMTNDQAVELAEKKLSGQEKEDFLAKMGKKKKGEEDKKRAGDDVKTKKDKEVDDGRDGPSKGARKAMDQATIKPGKKKKVSEEVNDILAVAGIALSEEAIAKLDAAYETDEE